MDIIPTVGRLTRSLRFWQLALLATATANILTITKAVRLVLSIVMPECGPCRGE